MDMQVVKDLRAQTGAGFSLCKEALEKTKGDFDKAVTYIQERSQDKVLKKAQRETHVGIIDVYAHGQERNIGVMVEINCESDFVARTPEFRELAHEIALQIAAMDPQCVSREDVPADVVKEQEALYAKDDSLQGKPAEIKKKILAGKMEKYYEQVCLLEQRYFRDSELTMKQLVDNAVVKFGENIKIARFIRWQL